MPTFLQATGVGRLLLLALAPALALAADPTTAHSPAELTVRDFFRPPQYASVRLNPAATHLAMLVFEEKTDSTGLRVFEFATKKTTGLRGTKTYDMREFRWVGDDQIVFTVSRDNIYASGLYAISRDCASEPRLLNGRDAVQVLGSPKARPDHFFAWVRRSARDDGRPGPLVELDLKRRFRTPFDLDFTQVTSSVAPPPGDSVSGWMPDRLGEIRYAVTQVKGKAVLNRRDEKQWTVLDLDLDQYHPLGVDTDSDTLLVARLSVDGRRDLVRLNTRDGRIGPVLHTDEKYDFGTGQIIYSSDDRDIIGLTYPKQAPTHVWFRDEEAALQLAVDSCLPPDRINLIVNRSRDGARLLVRSSSDRHPGTLYLVEPKAGTAAMIGNLAPWLPEHLLGPVMLTSFTARDGLKLDAYVTLPANYTPGHPAPTVVLPHGGPWVRDTWGYDPESQFFASRGYIVFRPNYRGSSGYNAEISLKPRMEFRKMHEDVTDGVRALIKAGIVDPARIAIVGGSFGGYLALCGVAFEPDLYRCAVSFAGIFDWAKVMKEARANDPDSARYDYLLRNLGNPKQQQEKFDAMSPLLAVARIKVPVFVAHGEDDPVADSSQSHRLVKALAKAGVPYEKMFASGEAHGFSSLKNRVELFTRIESFLKKNL